ncbi:RDD family protein [Stomatohabitans albus]|uniref:RDD family protein n=1 Tax=Stomatohabitans albus TaxID=3110766 RepID=UPI00300D8C6B
MQENVHEPSEPIKRPSEPIDLPPNPRRIDVPGVGLRPVASLGRRFIARVIDWLVLLPFQFVVIAVAVSVFGLGGQWLKDIYETASGSTISVEALLPPADVANQFWLVSMLWTAVSGAIAEVWATSVYGGTPGKLLIGIRVVSTTDGGRISLNDSFNRWALAIFPRMIRFPLLPLFGWLVWLSAAFDQTQFRGWHDKLANSVVLDWRSS